MALVTHRTAMHRRAPFILPGLAALALAGWWLFESRAVLVRTATATTGPSVELVYATGFVEPEHPVTVSSRATAPVQDVLVDEGEVVTRGQALVRLDDSEQHALLAQAMADARGRTLAEQRVTTLFAQGWVTRAARDEAVSVAQAARAQVAALGARLDQMTIRAGISGIVLKRDVEPGDLATSGKALLELGDPASVRVTATIDERDVVRVRAGQAALLSTDALAGKVFRGLLSEITPGGDPDQRAFRVRIALEEGTRLPTGLTLEVNIITREHVAAVLVPASAIADGHVWLVRDGHATKRAVRTGITGTDRVEILSGLAVGDNVIVNPPDGLADGDRVQS